MPSCSAVDIDGAGALRMHENAELNNDVLKGELGFDGFVISDWEGIDKLPGGTYQEKVARSAHAGVDMAMAPYKYGSFITAMTDNVAADVVTVDRVDDAVSRILTQKFALGLFDQPFTNRTYTDQVGSVEHRELVRQAAAATRC